MKKSEIVTNLLNELKKEKISYCIFKSIERLNQDLSGKGEDIDILIDKKSIAKQKEIFAKFNFKKRISPKDSEGVDMWIGYDIKLKKEILLHTHNLLKIGTVKKRFGRAKFREYRWAVEQKIIKRAILKNGVYIINPADELVLILIRACLKKKIKKADLERFNEMKKKVKYKDIILVNYFKSYLITEDILLKDNIKDIVKDKKVGKVIKKILKKDTRNFNFGLLKSEINYWVDGIKIKFFNYPKNRIRKKGFIVALQGIDGCGKTTQLKKFNNSYFKNTGVKLIYGGNKDYYFNFLNKSFSNTYLNYFFEVFRILDRRLRVIKALIYKQKGYLVIFDRYDYDYLANLETLRLNGKKISIIRKILFGWVAKKPDVVVFLDISPKEAYIRKQDYEFEKVKIGIKAYRNIFSKRSVLKINALNSSEAIHKSITDKILKL